MKLIRYNIYAAFLGLLLSVVAGCSQEEIVKQPSDGSTFTIRITGEENASALTKAETAENVTIPLHLFIYQAGGAATDIPLLYKTDALADAQEKAVKCSLQNGMTATDTYDIYVVAGDDSETAALSETITRSDLLALTQTGIDAINAKPDDTTHKQYMLAGATLGTSLDPSPTVAIYRNVCRLDLSLDNVSGTAFTSMTATLSAPDKTFVFRSEERGTGTENTFPADTKQDAQQTLALTDPGDGRFAGTAFFFEKNTTAAGIQSKADRVKLVIECRTADGATRHYLAYLNAEDDRHGPYTTRRNTIYQVNGTLKEGTVVITTTVLPWAGTVDDPHVIDPMFVSPKANSYVVKPGGQLYIPVTQVNDANAFDPTIPAIADREVLTQELVWTDVKGIVSGKGLADDASIAKIEVIGTGTKAVLAVKAGSRPGNAVVAVKSGTTIRWSWHIWVTDYNPEEEMGQNTMGGYVFMDRFLGAVSDIPTADNKDATGCYYQWGRKDPFPPKSATAALVPVYNAEGQSKTAATTPDITSMSQTVLNPFVYDNNNAYGAGATTWGETAVNDKLFNTPKTAFDPCPAGWRVPRRDAYIDYVSNTSLFQENVVKTAYTGKHTGTFPYTDHTRNGSATAGWNMLRSHIWTSGYTTTANNAYGFRIINGNSRDITNFPLYGFSVRCVRDWTQGKQPNEVRVMTAGRDAFSTSHSLGTAGASTGYADAVLPLLVNNFGEGEPVNAIFKFYNNTNSSVENYNVVDRLKDNDIDVLWFTIPWNYGNANITDVMTAQQAEDVKAWLDGDSRRVLGLTIDLSHGLNELFKIFGLSPANASETNGGLFVNPSGDPFVKGIVSGVYGDVSGATNFKVPAAGDYRTWDEFVRNGFVPILTTADGRVFLAIHPTQRVIVYGDSGMYDAGSLGITAAQNTGDLEQVLPSGPYLTLEANIWAWIVKTVKGY